MKPRHKRIGMIVGGLAALAAAAAFVLAAFRENLVFFFTPSQVEAKEVPQGRAFRIGGMVVPGSVKRQADGVTVQFMVTDTAKNVPVVYRGILPDLFKEGKGVVTQGTL
ncbi:MAG TPA: cytochrome c maturation protein CcmE, partial [Burkholderiales bacterium]|nr:cytochrome c maturation protein CcmE [Burkholderiales bacterium]